METKFNFKSQICTTREQSGRLLTLGLKKETADMCWTKVGTKSRTFYVPELAPINMVSWRHTPAWSLDRLKELYKCVGDTSLWNLDDVNYYRLIQCISLAIKHNSFNKEYLV